MSQKEYCHGEAAEFPADQFYRDENGALVHNAGHEEHYAATGDPVRPNIIPDAEEE